MIRIFSLVFLLVVSSYAFGQIDPWPGRQNQLFVKTEIASGIKAMAVRQNSDVIIIVFGSKPSPAYEATLIEMHSLLPDIIEHGEDKGPVLNFELKKKSSGTYAPQVVVPFAVTKIIQTESKSLWITYGKDEATLIDVISP